ncbi:glutathione S-transferase [Fusarium flagelliforme]|nr:glutathione S-transferase [Fusarium flagelliforme]KAH7193798.1 glutathione S-transferase [Fusarium flagelliforme]
MPKLTLYRTNGSCSLIPHAILHHYKIPFDAIRLKPGPHGYEAADGSFTNAEYRAIHPRGYVPALAVNDQIITEMPAILSFISSLVPNECLLGSTPFENAKVMEWLVFLSGTLHGLGYGAFLRPGRFSDDESAHEGIKEKGSRVVEEAFGRIDHGYKGREFIVGKGLTVVDFNVYVFARWAGEVGIDMEEYPSYYDHLRRIEKLDGVGEALKAENLALAFH